jgi:hypothetical protein
VLSSTGIVTEFHPRPLVTSPSAGRTKVRLVGRPAQEDEAAMRAVLRARRPSRPVRLRTGRSSFLARVVLAEPTPE